MNEIISPQTLSEEAQAAYQNADYSAAAQTYLAAAQSFEALHDLPSAAEMRNNASVAWLKGDNPQAAYRAADGTPALFAEIHDSRREGIAWGNIAAALEAMKRFPEAIQAYEKAVALFEACGEREYRSYVFKSLSVLKLQSGKQLEAFALMDAGLSGLPQLSGPQKLLQKLLTLWRRVMPH